jgi:hypothetical protein
MKRFSSVLAVLSLSALVGGLALFAIPAGAADPKDDDPTLTVSKTVLDAQNHVLTTLPAGEFRQNVRCADDKDKVLFDVTIVFDQTGTIKTLPALWTADPTNKIAMYHQGGGDTLDKQLCSVTEDAGSSALQGNGPVLVSYSCTAGGTDVEVGNTEETTATVAPEELVFGCATDHSGQFTTKNDPVGSCTAQEAGPPQAAVPAPTKKCHQFINLTVTNKFTAINVAAAATPVTVPSTFTG